MVAPCIVWLNRDLRTTDNEAFSYASNCQAPVIPVFIFDSNISSKPAIGSASRWWLHQSLNELSETLKAKGSKLIIRCGTPSSALTNLAKETGASRVVWNTCYDPVTRGCQKSVELALRKESIFTQSFKGDIFFDPEIILNGSDLPYKVFTPFWKACQREGFDVSICHSPHQFSAPPVWPDSVSIDDLALVPMKNWTKRLRNTWVPGELNAMRELEKFANTAMDTYSAQRDYPATPSTSILSPHLSFGEISPKQILRYVRSIPSQRSEAFIRQLGWREFSSYLLYHFPSLNDTPLRQQFKNFGWLIDENGLSSWQRGRTGYPIVDAGMRQLWQTGWMHNRIRMVVASFLVKDLLIDWRSGADWFWDTLVDADIANNSAGWQWVAGCGADAAPYFRIFNPITQGKKFDSEGHYVRRWVPELENLPSPVIHSPWMASASELSNAGIKLGDTYPEPIIDHSFARDRALSALSSSKL